MARVRRGRAWVFLVVWIALTSFALTFPFHMKHPPKMLERGGDKVIHTSLFTVMGLSAQAAAPWVSLLVTAPLAVGLELLQKKIPGRSYDITDMLANIVGMFLGLVSFELSKRLVT
ncbi:MAG: VanZ family protein [bacterium]